jgi:hypothetical protein
MKNSSRKSDSPANFSHFISGGAGKKVKKESNSLKEDNPLMTQLTVPSASVWDRIAEELDKQDSRRNNANVIINASFENKKKATNSYFVAFACISLLAGIILIIY